MQSKFFRLACAVAALASVAGCVAAPDRVAGEPAAPPAEQLAGKATPEALEDFLLIIGDRVFFDPGSAVVSAEGVLTLARQARWLARRPEVTATIEGHCDERGTRDYNLALGERRAYAVKMVLVAEGIDASRLTTVSYGKERPAVLGSDEAAWARNRRVVTAID